MTKKLFLAALLSAAGSLAAMAEGYQVNTLSAKQNGMGHTGTAMHLGAESQIFNPAGLAWLDKNVEVSASVTPIFSHVTADYEGRSYKTQSNAATPMAANIGFSVYDNFKAGISFYTPYGSTIDWTDNWPGSCLSQSVNLKVFTVQPTLAYRPIPNLAIGAGLMIAWGNVDLNKGLISPRSYSILEQINGLSAEGGITPASVNLSGTAKTTFGVNAGIMWDITPRWTLGASFRSKMNMSVEAGTASLHFANEQAKQILESSLGLIDQSRFCASMPAVAIWNVGVSYKPIDGLIIAADFQFSQWKAYKQLDIEFPDLPAAAQANFNQHIVKDYHNSMTYHLGAQYALTPRLDLRCGVMIDTTPVDKDHYNPETPGMTKVEPSVGFSFRPIDCLSIDLSFLYVAGCGAKNRTCTYDDFVAKMVYSQMGQAGLDATGLQLQPKFTADYSLYALAPSIGVTLSF